MSGGSDFGRCDFDFDGDTATAPYALLHLTRVDPDGVDARLLASGDVGVPDAAH